MPSPSCFLLFVVFIYLNQCSVQATVFSCNTTAPCGCSHNNVDINARIVGGEVAADHSWGWAVSLRNSRGGILCGGSVLSGRYILTAAHCLSDLEPTPDISSIIVGADRLNSAEGQKVSLLRTYIHPHYNLRTKENDIAILYLNESIDFNNINVAKICLPAVLPLEQSRYPIVKKSIVAIGWGRNSSGGSTSNALRQVTVQAVGNKDNTCARLLRNSTVQFCAAVKGGKKDTCQGDSGGPIMYYSESDRVWVLAGITSYGHGCALANYAGVYTRVSVYIDWIRSIVGDDGLVTVSQNKATIVGIPQSIIYILTIFLTTLNIYT